MTEIARARKSVPLQMWIFSFTRPKTEALDLKWEGKLGKQIPDDLWVKSLENIHTGSTNALHCFIEFKSRPMHRLHYSKEKLCNIYTEVLLVINANCRLTRCCL